MKIAQGCVVAIEYDICTDDGEIVESSDINGTVSFVHGKRAIIPGLDRKLLGLSEGDERSFTFGPEEAFGKPEDAPRKIVKRSEFPSGATLAKGESFEAGIPGGQRIRLEVLEVAGDNVTVRMVHPLAGKTVTMHVTVLKVRDATPAERDSGMVQHAPPPPPVRASQ